MKNIIIIFSISLLLYGCVVSQKETINRDINLPQNVKHIYIPVFKADMNVYDPNIPQIFTNELITQFNLDGSLLVESSREKANAILEGKIKNYIRKAVDYDENNLPVLYRINMEAEITFVDNSTGEKLWTENEERLFATTTYSERVPPIETEFIAQKRVIEELAIKIVNRTVNGWSTSGKK